MSITRSGNVGSTSWVNNLGIHALNVDFGSVQANAMLVMATAISSNDGFPYYVDTVTDNRGNTWHPLSTIEYGVWANTGSFKSSIPRNLTTQLWYALDTSSPATGYTVTATMKSSTTDDAGNPQPLNMDAGIMTLIRLAGVNFSNPFDSSPHSGHGSIVDTTSGGVQPTQTNVLASDTTNIAIISAFGGIGTLNGASAFTNYTNNGTTVGGTGVRTDINGFADGGPANNALGLVLDVCTTVTGPWNLASNQVQNQNSMHCDEMITRIITADVTPLRKRVKSRIIT